MTEEKLIRINKYLADKGIATRKEADKIISAKKVTINGRIAVLGDKVSTTDNVEVIKKIKSDFIYYAYNKPRGVITHSPQKGEVDILTSTKLKGVFPIGRLDKDSEGLIILTNDGRITDRLLNPKYEHEKEYLVQTRVPVKDSHKRIFERGMELEGINTKPAKVRIIDDFNFSIILKEGQKHQIRRMCDALSLPIESLKRVRIMNLKLEKLAPNSYRKIEGDELKEFLKSLNLA
jgi:23S rRNA pseudouridine2604 synthase